MRVGKKYKANGESDEKKSVGSGGELRHNIAESAKLGEASEAGEEENAEYIFIATKYSG
jgi:hypothetical protein